MAESTSDLLERYTQGVEQSLKWRQELYDPTWRESIDFYRSRPPGSEIDCEKKIQVNLIHSTVNIIVANTLLRYPKITVSPRQVNQANYSKSVLGAALSESSINYYWRRYRYQEQFRLSFKDSVICGHGWVKCMWDFSEVNERLTQDAFAERYQDTDAKKAVAVAMQKAPMGGSEVTPTTTQREQERHGTDIIRDMPRVERISVFHMLVDPDATTMENARWVAQIVRIPRNEAEANKKWDKSAREALTPDSPTDREMRYYNPDRRERPFDDNEATELVTYYEFYDMQNGTWCQFGEGADRFLVKPEVMPYKFGLPFEFMGNHQVPDQFYPMGDVETLTDLQAELNITRTQIIEDRKKYRRQWLYKPENVTDELVEMLESDSDDKMAPVADDAEFDDVMSPVPQLPIDPQLYDVSAMISRDIDVISGTTDYQRGGAPAGRTATEAAILNDASQSRAAEKLFGVEQAMARISEKVVMLMQQYMTESDVARIGNMNAIIPNSPTAQQVGNEVFYKFDRENIAGLYDFTVEAGSTQPVNEAVRRQEALQLANVMIPFVQTGLVDGQRVAEELLRRGFGIDDPSTFLAQGGPSLLQQQAAGPATPATPQGGAPPVGAIPVAGEDGQNPAPDPTGGDIGSINQLAGQIGLNLQ